MFPFCVGPSDRSYVNFSWNMAGVVLPLSKVIIATRSETYFVTTAHVKIANLQPFPRRGFHLLDMRASGPYRLAPASKSRCADVARVPLLNSISSPMCVGV
jgi:hypothetical protein